MTKPTTVPIYFVWEDFKPDQRTYRQQSMSLQPNTGENKAEIQIDVPLEHDLIANFEAIAEAKISNGGKAPDPILTLKGVKWITDQWDEIFYKSEEKEEVKATSDDDWGDDSKTASTDDDWGETPETVSQPANGKADDEWAEESKADDKDAPWDETKEDWGGN
jgi:hypothetical protein